MKIEFSVGGYVMRAHDAAVVLDDEDPLQELIAAAVETISTTVEITCGGVTMHLAAWKDPDHWSSDWREKGIDPDEVDALVIGAAT
jgi:hypothetical protein